MRKALLEVRLETKAEKRRKDLESHMETQHQGDRVKGQRGE